MTGISNEMLIPNYAITDVLGNATNNGAQKMMNVPIKVVGITENIDTGEYMIDFNIFDMISKVYRKNTMSLSDISVKAIRKLVAKNGGDCRNIERFAEFICKYLYYVIEKNDNLKYQYESLGWGVVNNDVIFKASQIYSSNQKNISEYIGRLLISEKGSFEEYKDMIEKDVIGHIPLEAVLAMGAGATLISYLNDIEGIILNNPINHLVGNSTTGKSTAAALFVSMGAATSGVDSLMLSFLGTPNSLLKRMEGIHGLPCAIDEFSTGMSKKAWSDFIYMMANGIGKERCTAGGNAVQRVETFSSVIVTNGEMSILRKCNQNEGLRARLFEFCDVGWTESAESAEYIKKICSENYGFLTPMIAKEILSDSAKWVRRFEKWRAFVRKKIENDKIMISLGGRIADYVALYTTAVQILQVVLGMNFNVKKVFHFFYDWIVVKNAEKCNLGTRVYDAITLYVAMNKSKFHHVSTCFSDVGELEEGKIGFKIEKAKPKVIDGKEYNVQCLILPDKLEEILSAKGFTDIDVAMKSLKEMKLLQTKDKSRTDYVKTINNIKTKVYCIWIIEDAFEFYMQTMEEMNN